MRNKKNVLYTIQSAIDSVTFQIQQRAAVKLYSKFNDWLQKWEHENVSRDMARQTNNWLLGKISGTSLIVKHSLSPSVICMNSAVFSLIFSSVAQLHKKVTIA